MINAKLKLNNTYKLDKFIKFWVTICFFSLQK